MAGITGSARHGTLTADEVTTVVIDALDLGINITNRGDSPAFEMWVRLDGVDPAPNAADSFLVTGTRQFSATGSTTVKMISKYPIMYSVETY